MMIPPFNYYHPKSISELITILGDLQDNSRILAGGTDIVPGFIQESKRFISIQNLIDINDSIVQVTKFFELRLKEKEIDIRLNLENQLGNVKIDYHLFQEVVMNLLLNSYDAIAGNGIITISTGRVDNSYVFMKIEDNGTGISEENLKKIFDPFFTTKDIGTGTGLGLSVCLGIIESHGGNIDVQSTENSGTVFTITLPNVNEDETINN